MSKRATKDGKLSVAVVPDDPNFRWTPPILASAVEDAMMKAGRFRVLSRSSAIDKEQARVGQNRVSEDSAIKLGRELSANYVVVIRQLSMQCGSAKIIRFRCNPNIQLQALDTETSEMVASETQTAQFEITDFSDKNSNPQDNPNFMTQYRKVLDGIVMSFSTKMAAAVPLEGVVVMIRDAKNIALNLGSDLGLRVGNEFELIQEGEPIKGPDGAVLGYDSHTIGRVRVTRVEPKLTWAELVSTVSTDGSQDATPNVTRVKQYTLARMVAASK